MNDTLQNLAIFHGNSYASKGTQEMEKVVDCKMTKPKTRCDFVHGILSETDNFWLKILLLIYKSI